MEISLQQHHNKILSYLPPSILNLFVASEPPPFVKPKKKKQQHPLSGVADYLQFFEDKEQYEKDKQPWKVPLSIRQQKDERRKEKGAEQNETIKQQLKEWNPQKDPKAIGDPENTLFVSRIAYDVTEDDLKNIFQSYGEITNIRIVKDSETGKSRGYAFIEFASPDARREAFEKCDGMKIHGRKVIYEFFLT